MRTGFHAERLYLNKTFNETAEHDDLTIQNPWGVSEKPAYECKIEKMTAQAGRRRKAWEESAL